MMDQLRDTEYRGKVNSMVVMFYGNINKRIVG